MQAWILISGSGGRAILLQMGWSRFLLAKSINPFHKIYMQTYALKITRQ